MNILISCIGKSDPMSYDENGREIPGPLLTLLEEQKYNCIHLLWVPDADMNLRATKTRKMILDKYGDDTRVNFHELNALDPADLDVLYPEMSKICSDIQKKYTGCQADYSIQISSGTPQMQTVWMVIAGSGLIPAKLIAMSPRYIKKLDPPYARYIDFDLASHLTDAPPSEDPFLLKQLKEELTRVRMENEELKAGGACINEEAIPDNFNLTEYLKNEKRKYYAMAIKLYPDNASAAARVLGLQPHAFRIEAERMNLRLREK